ncbi:hypothetical protein RvY_02730 [Ramazzottius varieornatus]|uniref:Uncharacterized protein n=1 Tax=Ramazzottius varieornatus TaxID=947166 RepID=A0A1D1URI0_RAMVA|nr:hypothetical protein RvY_02730 [Ramazzottius varieornatus]
MDSEKLKLLLKNFHQQQMQFVASTASKAPHQVAMLLYEEMEAENETGNLVMEFISRTNRTEICRQLRLSSLTEVLEYPNTQFKESFRVGRELFAKLVTDLYSDYIKMPGVEQANGYADHFDRKFRSKGARWVPYILGALDGSHIEVEPP